MKKKILFLCTGNSCRSQMAEGWARYFHGNEIEFYSAGIEKHGMNQRAIKVMEEVGINISSHTSKIVEELGPIQFDIVYTVCGHAHEHCPLFLGNSKIIHIGFEDPPKLSQGLTNEEEIMKIYRKVRDEIKEFAKNIKANL